MDAMSMAAARGVDVRVAYPENCDLSFVLDRCSASYVAQALEAGISVGHYALGFLHSKLFVTDDVCCIGSTNIDSCSMFRYLEMMVIVHDADFAAAMKEHFHSDEAHVHYLNGEEWSERPFITRSAEHLMRPLGRVL